MKYQVLFSPKKNDFFFIYKMSPAAVVIGALRVNNFMTPNQLPKVHTE